MGLLTAQFFKFLFSIFITLVGIIINRFFENKPKLIAFYGSVSEVTLKNEDGSNFKAANGQDIHVRSHSIVIMNTGKLTANNIRIIHEVLPINYKIYPQVNYRKENNELIISNLVPYERITITYLYYPPLHVSQINQLIKCDECLSIPGNMQHIDVTPSWLRNMLYILLLIGAVTTIYFLLEIIQKIYFS